jgi:hypothetical protein
VVQRLLLGTALATLMASQASATLRHLYTFNDGTANDSAGTAHGTLVNGAATTFDGQVDLDGADDYVDLPGGTIAINTYTNVTLESWFTLDATPAWQRLYDFGDTNVDNLGRNYIFYSPSTGLGDHRAVISDADPGFNSEQVAIGGPTLGTGLEHHIAVTISNGGNMTLYRNGVQVAQTALTKSLATVSTAFALLGESTYPGDSNLNGRIDEFRIYDTALSATDVLNSFNTGPARLVSPPVLTIDRVNGAMTLSKQGAPFDVFKYTINSPSGALDPTKWQTITDNRDADNGGSFDASDTWTVLTATNFSLSEEDPVDGGSDNGGPLGVGPGATPSLPLLSPGGWVRTYREDVTMTLDILVGGVPTLTPVTVAFTGNGGQPYKRSDFNFDNALTAADYNVLLSNHLKTLTETTAATAYVKGDINGDLRNDVNDFRLFKADYIAANGEAAFAALMVSIPEPGSAVLLLGCAVLLAVHRRR